VILTEQNDEWQSLSRDTIIEAFAQIYTEETEPIVSTRTKLPDHSLRLFHSLHHVDGRDFKPHPSGQVTAQSPPPSLPDHAPRGLP
jgi:hypothetical protein